MEAGVKRVATGDTTFLADLDALIEPTKCGDPMRGLRWTCKSTRQLAKALGSTKPYKPVAKRTSRGKQYKASKVTARHKRGRYILIVMRNLCTFTKHLAHFRNVEIQSSPLIQRKKRSLETTKILVRNGHQRECLNK